MNRQPVKDDGRLRPGMFREPIIPSDDLDYQGDDIGLLRLGRDILPMIALMTIQTPIGPRVVQGNEDGTIPITGGGSAETIISPLTEGISLSRYLATVPVGFTWEVIGGRGQYQSSATLGNRSIRLTYTPASGGALWLSLADALQAPGLTLQYTLESVAPSYAGVLGAYTEHYMLFPPGLVLKAGDTILWRDEIGIDYPNDRFPATVYVKQKAV